MDVDGGKVQGYRSVLSFVAFIIIFTEIQKNDDNLKK